MGMKFGFCFEHDVTWDELLTTAQELDRNSRFDHLWVTDALVGRELGSPRLDGWTALAALAQATTRVRLGVMVSGNPFRHPALLAKMATTVDHISGGRLEFGIGSGWPGENARLGVPFHDRRERLERLGEALRVIRLLWTERRPSFRGRYYRLDDAPFSPANVQRPHPPIIVGGATRPILRIVAEHGDACNVSGAPAQAVRQFGLIDQFCREHGRSADAIRRTTELPLMLNDDPSFQQRAMEWAIATFGGSEETVRTTSIFGSLDEVKARIEGLAEVGMQEVIVFQLPRLHLKSLMRFSDEAIPAFS